MGRPPCCDKSNVKRGLWTTEEDAKILAHVSDHGTGNWTLVPKKAGLNRCGKSCRLRWTNYLRPDLKHDSFTPEEEDHIINLHRAIGSRWSLIAQQLPGRTDNDVKNYWNTKMRKKLSKMGIDPVTHKPFSQILTDYGNISGLANAAGNHFGRNIQHNMLMSKSESYSVVHGGFQSSKNMIMKPRTGIVSNPSWEFLSEVNTTCSSSSPSSSSAITQLSSTVQSHNYSCQPSQPQIITPSSPFSWSEFLLSDPIFSPDHDHDHEMLSSTNSYETTGFQINSTDEQNFGNGSVQITSTTADVSSSSGVSFVDAILCQDKEMNSQLFELLDDSSILP